MVKHGFCVFGGTKVLLGFTETAPVFSHLSGRPLHKLVAQEDIGDPVVGFSVCKEGEGHGFLFTLHEYDKAVQEAALFTTLFNTRYVVVNLKIGDRI